MHYRKDGAAPLGQETGGIRHLSPLEPRRSHSSTLYDASLAVSRSNTLQRWLVSLLSHVIAPVAAVVGMAFFAMLVVWVGEHWSFVSASPGRLIPCICAAVVCYLAIALALAQLCAGGRR